MTSIDIQAITDKVKSKSDLIQSILNELSLTIIGQKNMLEKLMIVILADGHILLEGVPGLAKTTAVNALAKIMDTGFSRIQFTPDLLPADLLGTLIFNPKSGEFSVKKGPLFSNLILADEINRAPAKVQSALLEAMQERQVTIGNDTYKLEEPFLVLATQNPIEQEGTYPLPEAQLDRFIMKLKVMYPKKSEEKEIINRMTSNEKIEVTQIVSPKDIMRAREVVNQIYVDDKIKDYVLDVVFATRNPEEYNLSDLKTCIEYGASPRASIYLIQAAKAHAFIKRRGYVTPEDIKSIGRDVLRHRIIPSFEAEAEELDSDAIIDRLFSEIEVP